MFGVNNYNPPGWRLNNLPKYFGASTLDPNETNIYEFGVFLGGSIVTIGQSMRAALGRTNRVVGFDSFEGIPPELNEPVYEGAWASDKKGDLNQTFHPGRWIYYENPQQVANWVKQNVLTEIGGNFDLDLFPGWYDEILTKELVEQAELKPAFYVDFDADTYSSTKDAFVFLCEHDLIVPGTILGFDDWGGAPNDRSSDEPLGGECRAFFEIVEEYLLVSNHIDEFDFEMGRQQRMICVVEEIG